MIINLTKKDLLPALKMVVGVVEQKQTLPILGNVLLKTEGNNLHMTGTDSEIEISCTVPLASPVDEQQETTMPARKVYDIVRALPQDCEIKISLKDHTAIIKAGKSRFSLACLPANDFPGSLSMESKVEFKITQRALKDLLVNTSFAMGNKDVRNYLNGLLFDLTSNGLCVVGTDGHRMAFSTQAGLPFVSPSKVIIPRKAVKEFLRLLDNPSDAEVAISIDTHHIQMQISDALTLTSKLISEQFPAYEQIVSQEYERSFFIETATLKSILNQASIISNEKYRGVRLAISQNKLTVSSRNPTQEECEVECEVEYVGEDFEVGYNVDYLQDALSVVTAKEVELSFSSGNDACLIRARGIDNTKCFVMPMRL